MCKSVISSLVSSNETYKSLVEETKTLFPHIEGKFIEKVARSLYYWEDSENLTNLDNLILPALMSSYATRAWIPMSLMLAPNWVRMQAGHPVSVIFHTHLVVEQLDAAFNRLAMNQLVLRQLQNVLATYDLQCIFMCTCKVIIYPPDDFDWDDYKREQSLRNLTHSVAWQDIEVDLDKVQHTEYFGLNDKSIQMLSTLEQFIVPVNNVVEMKTNLGQ